MVGAGVREPADSVSSLETSSAPEIDAVAADELVRGGAVLVDVREPVEFDAGHAPAAVPLPMRELRARVDELPTGVPVVCVCRVGERSAIAAAFLCASGRDARNLAGGMLAWSADGLPVVSGDGGSGTVI